MQPHNERVLHLREFYILSIVLIALNRFPFQAPAEANCGTKSGSACPGSPRIWRGAPPPSPRRPSINCRKTRSSSPVSLLFSESVCSFCAGSGSNHLVQRMSMIQPVAFRSCRAKRDLGGEASAHGVDPAPARGRLRRDGRGHEGGRTDRGILQSEKGSLSRRRITPICNKSLKKKNAGYQVVHQIN